MNKRKSSMVDFVLAKSMFGILNGDYDKNYNFFTRNRMCCNVITKPIH